MRMVIAAQTALSLLTGALTFALECPPEGQDTRNDPQQNVVKNRDTAPPSYEEMTIGQFKKTFKKNLIFLTRRENFTEEQLTRVAPDERRDVTLTGYAY